MQKYKEIKSLLFAAAAAGMWSIVYPELVYHPDVVRVVDERTGNTTENENAADDQGWDRVTGIDAQKSDDAGNIYEQLLETDRENIRLKSRIWEMWLKWRKQR